MVEVGVEFVEFRFILDPVEVFQGQVARGRPRIEDVDVEPEVETCLDKFMADVTPGARYGDGFESAGSHPSNNSKID